MPPEESGTTEATSAPEATTESGEGLNVESMFDSSPIQQGDLTKPYDNDFAQELMSYGEESETADSDEAETESETSDKESEEKKEEVKFGAKTKEASEETKEDSTKEAKEESAEESEAEDKSGDDDTETAETQPVVKFKTADGKEVAVPEDAKVVVSINGKNEEVSVSELSRNYQGKIPWNEKYNELKSAEKVLINDQKVWKEHKESQQNFLQEITDLAKTDPWGALVKVAIEDGQNPTEFLPQYLQQAEATIQGIKNMSQEEVALLIKEKALGFQEELLEKKKKVTEEVETSSKEQQELQTYIAKRHKELGMTNEEGEKAFKFLMHCDADPNHPFSFEGLTDKQKADAAFQYFVKFERPFTRVENVLREVDPELLKDREFVKLVKKSTLDADPNFSDNDIKQVVLGVVGKKPAKIEQPAATDGGAKVEAVSAKPSTESPKPKPGATSGTSPKEKAEPEEDDENYQPMDMEDILNRYR